MLRKKVMYSNNPRRLMTLDVFDEEGNKVESTITSRLDGVERESFYTYRKGKRHLERRSERRRNTVTIFIFPDCPKGEVRITETFYREGKPLYISELDERCQPVSTYWYDTGETVCYA